MDMMHLDLLMGLKDLDTKLRRLEFLEQVPFNDYIQVIMGPNFTKLAWLVHLVILMHLTALDPESEP